jgi:hypothetical protein
MTFLYYVITLRLERASLLALNHLRNLDMGLDSDHQGQPLAKGVRVENDAIIGYG